MSESVAVIVWGAALGGRREHAYRTYPEAAWWPTNYPPKALCGTARSPETGVVPAKEGSQRCERCARIAAQQVESGMAQNEPPAEGTPGTVRDEFIKGLRDLADWLEANPSVPLREFDGAIIQHSIDLDVPDRGDAVAELDRLAVELGVKVGPLFGDGDSRHYGFTRKFGPVRYQAVSIAKRGAGR